MSVRSLRGPAVGLIAAAFVIVGPRAAHAADAPDTVFLSDGGRVRGTVMVEDGKEVRVQLVDGTTKIVPKATVQRVQYGAATPPAAPPVTPTPLPPAPALPSQIVTPVARDDDAPLAPRRRHSRYVSDDDENGSPPPPRHMVMRSPGLVAGGAVMVTLGLCAMIAGAVGTAALAASDNTDALPALLAGTEGGGALLVIPGAVMIGVGRHRVPAPEDSVPETESIVFQPKVNGFKLSF